MMPSLIGPDVRLADTGRDLRGTLVDDHRVVVEEAP